MNIQKVASAKGKPVVGHSIQLWTKHYRHVNWHNDFNTRDFGTGSEVSSRAKVDLIKEHVKGLENQQKAKKEAKALDKDFFLSVLHSSVTKRDAKSYIQQFKPTKPSAAKKSSTNARDTCGVNLGNFYAPAAVEESPRFVQHPQDAAKAIEALQLHLALVKIRAPQTLSDEIIDGIGNTLSQLERLGLISAVVVDCNDKDGPLSASDTRGSRWRQTQAEQANRVISAIEKSGSTGARLVDNIIGIKEEPSSSDHTPSRVYITLRKLLMTPLRRGVIPVIPCVGYTDSSQVAQMVPASDLILALTREFAGLPANVLPDDDPIRVQQRMQTLRKEVSLDRLIVLDPLGGIPATDQPNKYHVFLNMEQEFASAKQDLLNGSHLEEKTSAQMSEDRYSSVLASDASLLRVSKTEYDALGITSGSSAGVDKTTYPNWHHLQNLQLLRSVLSMLPPSSSALLTTPDEAANRGSELPFQAARVGTRRQRNPLIHNLLTDKPVFSSSLPVGRLSPDETVSSIARSTPTTFVKHGMSVTIIPDVRQGHWQTPDKPHLRLTNSEIDLPRLVHLIEDSFGRKLDVQAYLERVNDRLAGVIIAGEYEGGALLTWETPPGVPDDGSPESRARMVPYLDKFAVLRRSQGSGGVADLIFKAMVRDCFPNGVVWRSRKDNPVNKWYFERSRGTWKIPETGWTMFWTTPELSRDKQLFHDFAGVCRTIEPSWADNKAILD